MRLGWYVHHHGRGHLHRLVATRPALAAELTVLSSLARPDALSADTDWIQLPLDVPADLETTHPTAGGVLHWAPLGHRGLRERMGALAAWIVDTTPDAIVVDVSVEVALLARSMGVPVIWIAQRGLRDDLPHQLAYAAAQRILAPWTAATAAPPGRGRPPVDRTVFTGALSRFDDRPPAVALDASARRVAVLLGAGGHALDVDTLAAAATATPDWTWEVAGLGAAASDPRGALWTSPGPGKHRIPAPPDPRGSSLSAQDRPNRPTPRSGSVPVPNLVLHDPDVDVWALLGRCRVAVATASGNAVAEVAAARRPLICLPQTRPFDEQIDQAGALAAAGLAIDAGPRPDAAAWPDLLDRAERLDTGRWSLLHDGRGAERLAAAILEAAASA